MTPPTTLDEEKVLTAALEAGFDLAGIAPFEPPPAAERFREWIARGHHAGMSWLERDAERIADPRRVLAGGRSLLVVGLGHARPPVELEGGGRVARYAAGRDYHHLMRRRLEKLRKRLGDLGLRGVERGEARAVVDAGPVLERSHAARAGIGFESKAANLLHPRFGPWYFLGELLLSADLAPTEAPALGSCGSCTACLDACPTGAILEPGVVDAGRCISYQTIENRGAVPRELRPELGSWVFGCDVCSEVCPWGSGAPDAAERFGTHDAVRESRLVDWLAPRDGRTHAERFHGSPLQRPRREGVARNAALALGNTPGADGGGALREALAGDPAPLVREAAAWGLARLDAGGATRRALLAARDREVDPEARAGIERTLDEIGTGTRREG